MEGLQHLPRLLVLAQPTPESHVQKDDIDQVPPNRLGKLFEIHRDGIGGGRDRHELVQSAHAFQAPAGTFDAVVVQIIDRPIDIDGLLD